MDLSRALTLAPFQLWKVHSLRSSTLAHSASLGGKSTFCEVSDLLNKKLARGEHLHKSKFAEENFFISSFYLRLSMVL